MTPQVFQLFNFPYKDEGGPKKNKPISLLFPIFAFVRDFFTNCQTSVISTI